MNIISKYIAYLKDNPEGYWFKRKLYGWGWTPATWHGWALTVAFIALLIWNARRFEVLSASNMDVLRPFLIETLFMVLVFIFICYKTGESPQWQWGPTIKK